MSKFITLTMILGMLSWLKKMQWILLMLLSLESSMTSIILMMTMKILENEISMISIIIFLYFMVCEAILGLSSMINLSRVSKKSKFFSQNLL